jgi:hypothetical protein
MYQKTKRNVVVGRFSTKLITPKLKHIELKLAALSGDYSRAKISLNSRYLQSIHVPKNSDPTNKEDSDGILGELHSMTYYFHNISIPLLSRYRRLGRNFNTKIRRKFKGKVKSNYEYKELKGKKVWRWKKKGNRKCIQVKSIPYQKHIHGRAFNAVKRSVDYQAKKLNLTRRDFYGDIALKKISIPLTSLYDNGTEGEHVDHIIPVSWFNILKENELRACWDIRNLRYLSAEDNLKRGNSMSIEDKRHCVVFLSDLIKNCERFHELSKTGHAFKTKTRQC